jgi:hypothetical protein
VIDVKEKNDRNRLIVAERDDGAKWSEVASRHGISETRARQVYLATNRRARMFGDPDRAEQWVTRLTNALGWMVDKPEFYNKHGRPPGGFDKLKELDWFLARVTCEDLAKLRNVGAKTMRQAIGWVAQNGTTLGCGCPAHPCGAPDWISHMTKCQHKRAGELEGWALCLDCGARLRSQDQR